MRILHSLVIAAGLAVAMGHASAACVRCAPIENVSDYKSSINLNAAEGQIHKNHNSWIFNLAKGVNAQTALL